MPSCNTGKCVNDNICDCSSTGFIGRYCNEYRKLERCRLLDIIFMSTSIIMIFTSIILFILLFQLRDNVIIKGGSVEFSSLILVGSVFNALYLLTTTTEKTKLICLFYILQRISQNELLYIQNGISVLIKDLVGSIGCVICTFSVFYFLFIRKLRKIYIQKKLEKEEKSIFENNIQYN
ncbi:hypothetical protein H8356DRAFT_1280735 [Neocallimastix lanati (nom. inval.)]|nr:hypothetical protein H8356DRAFT_1280735 [Neocallimastix sp. JGI-2020a]